MTPPLGETTPYPPMTAAKRHTILIVEDESIFAVDLQQTLREMGYDAFAVAASAEQALAIVAQRAPSLILMDIRIRGEIDGIDTAALLRERFLVPIVFLTAHADAATLERAKATAPHGYLVKPVRNDELRTAIEMALYRHELERSLRERERWFSTTLRSIGDAVVAVDLAGKITFMNHVAEQLLGVVAADVVGRAAREVVRLEDLARGQETELPIDRALRDLLRVDLPEVNLVSARGKRVIADSASPVIDDDELLGAVMVFRDVTERRRLQQQVELSDRLASLGTMAAGVGHEINNPLAVIVANVAYLTNDLQSTLSRVASGDASESDLTPLLAEQAQAHSEIQSAADRIERIVADLRAFARPQAAESGCANVARAVDWARRSTQALLKDRAELLVSVPDELQAAIDELRLEQVIVNLVVNAAHAIAPGDPTNNRVEVRAGLDDSDRVWIDVEDTGCGMSEATQARIFEPFFTTKPVDVGTGLGLSICHGLIKSADGEIRVTTAPNEGSTFRVCLPRPNRKEDWRAHPVPQPAGRAKVLLIDDEPPLLRVLTRTLREHDVTPVGSARDAMALLDQGAHFDVILCDLVMPHMNGIDFYEALLERHAELTRRVVFVSGGMAGARADHFRRAVTNVFLTKPATRAQLLAAVARVVVAERRA